MSHKKPVTRRDFLAQGLLSTTTVAMMPSLITLLSARRAFGAETCAAVQASTKTPFICVDLAGGANIAGSNVMVGKAGGQMDFLSAYEKLGLPTGMRPQNAGQVSTELGLAFHNDSGILRGIRSVTSATTRANVDGVVFCTQSGDDTGNNPHNPTYWVAKSGLTGALTKLIGTNNTTSGGNAGSPAISVNPAIKPVRLSKPEDARNLVTLGQLNLQFTPTKVDRILGAINNMSASHLAAFQAKDLPTQLAEIVSCGYTKSRAITQDNADNYDPRRDPLAMQVFPNIANNTEDQKVATIAKLVLDNIAGAGTITKGGYDYHNGNRADGEGKDFEAGVAIGQCLELAARKGKDLMIYVFTDGGVSSSGAADNSANGRGKGVWTGDSGERSAAFALVYRAGTGRPSLRNNLRQIGYFADGGQAVDTQSSLIARNVENLSMAVLLNYMALDGTEGQLTNMLGGTNPFAASMDKYLMFNKLA
jgi:hypothetical protein